MTQPTLTFNWIAVGAATVAGFVWGFLWYGPICGKPWAKLMGFPADFKPDQKKMTQAMILQFVGLFLMTFVIAHSVQIWRPSVWGLGGDGPNSNYGFLCGFFTWIGFFIPQQFGKVAWEGRPWKLFFINIVHDFVNLQIISQILAHWR